MHGAAQPMLESMLDEPIGSAGVYDVRVVVATAARVGGEVTVTIGGVERQAPISPATSAGGAPSTRRCGSGA